MKQLFAVLAALLMVSTLAFSQNMQRGDFSGDLNSEGWTLSTGVGVRSQIIFVSFSKPFDSTPELVLTLTGYEATPGKDSNVRVALKIEKVTKEGCVVKVQTWGDSRVNAVYGSFLAFSR